MRIVTCLTEMHDPFLLSLAIIACVFGSWVSMDLFVRYQDAKRSMGIWLYLSGISIGSTIWCTHFVAMLAFLPTASASFDTSLTLFSLLLAISGSTVALAVARDKFSKARILVGGLLLGGAVSVMHYVGMAAYQYGGVLQMDAAYVVASVLFSAVFGALTLVCVSRYGGLRRRIYGFLCLVAAIAGLHFTGMGAIEILSVAPEGMVGHDVALIAFVIAGVCAVVIGAAFTSSLVEARLSRDAADNLRLVALTDPLTQLPNRAHFSVSLTRVIAATQSGGRLTVIGIDLDHFKEINDLRGHASGDEALKTVASRMSSVLLPGEFIARLGGDEFAAFKAIDIEDEALELATRLRNVIVPPIVLPDGSEAVVDGCFGITVYPKDGATAESLIGKADLAMYRAKSLPTEFAVFYEPAMDEAVRERRKVVSDLRLALAASQFELYYQVQESLLTNLVTGHEALLRWNHPERGIVSPIDFIPAAEETGLIIPIGEWVLEQACKDAAERPELGRVAVNLSAVQFGQPDLPGVIAGILQKTGLPAARLEIELTETTLMDDPDRNLGILRDIRALGVSVAMDDFGTGYSSLSTLRRFQFDKIKLDRSFMSEVETSAQAKSVIRAVLSLGNSLDIAVLAEGVETEEQLAFLKGEGCSEAQGYLLGRPGKLRELKTAIAA